MKKKGRLFVVSAPSGSGKTTLCEKLIQSFSGEGRRLVRSISVTTRRARKGERRGKDYFFISRQAFLRQRKQGQFLEWANVLGNFYATPRDFVQRQLGEGNDVLLSIDVQGALKIKRKVKKAVLIFILPPSLEELKRRLEQRSTEKKADIARRLALAKKELRFIQEYNYVVLNDKINQALRRLKKIIQQERQRQCLTSRLKSY